MERNNIKGNDVIYKELNLGNVTIKRYFSREHKDRSVAPIVCGGTRSTYVSYLFSVLACSVSTDQQEKERKKERA